MLKLINKSIKVLLLFILSSSLYLAADKDSKALETPTFKVEFLTPAYDYNSSDKYIDITIKITPTGTTNVSGGTVGLNLFDTDKPVSDKYVKYIDFEEAKPTNNDPITFEFKKVPLRFKENYFKCSIGTVINKKLGYAHCGPNSSATDQDFFHKINYSGTLSPLYRFYSGIKLGHFYTTNNAEKEHLIETDMSWRYEDIAYYVGDKNSSDNCDSTGRSAIYRFWNAGVQHHFYTISPEEKDHIINNDKAWAFEGIAFCADTAKSEVNSEVYRFYSISKNSHFFRIDFNEKESLIKNDPTWSYEGVAYFAEK